VLTVDHSGTKKMFFGSLKFGIQHIIMARLEIFSRIFIRKKRPNRANLIKMERKPP